MPEIIKYDGCTYQCYLKQIKSRTGKEYPRVFCRREDPKCVPGVIKPTAVEPKAEPSPTDTLAADIRIVITNAKAQGETLDNLRHIFKDYASEQVMTALEYLRKDGQIVEVSPNQYLSAEPIILTTYASTMVPSIREKGLTVGADALEMITIAIKHGVIDTKDIPQVLRLAIGAINLDRDTSNKISARYVSEGISYVSEGISYVSEGHERAAKGPDSESYKRMANVFKAARLKMPIFLTPEPEKLDEEIYAATQQKADILLAHLQPIPQKRMSAKQLFSLRTPELTANSSTYIGTASFLVVKWFRPNLTAQLELCYAKRPIGMEPENYEKAAAELLSKTYATDFKKRQWKPFGYLPKADKKAEVEVPFQSRGQAMALLIDCQNHDLAIVKYRYLKAFLDGCKKTVLGGNDHLSAIIVECLGNPIGLFMPNRLEMTDIERTTLAKILCQARG